MRLLFVGMLNSVHLARWVTQVADQGWEVHLFPSTDAESPHALIAGLPLVFHRASRLDEAIEGTRSRALRLPLVLARLAFRTRRRPPDRASRLRELVVRIKPDLVHSLETQAAGYLVEQVARTFPRDATFPPWLHTNWGSDIYLFGRLAAHRERVARVMASCDYYSCESRRDAELAHRFGFKGKVVACFPNTGGFDIGATEQSWRQKVTSKRSVILLKGYQGWAGRALVAIKALELLSNALKGYEVLIYGNPQGTDVAIAAELLSLSSGVTVRLLPYTEVHEEMLGYFASARIYVGLSISDSISTSLLEAMCMGAFPIQSDTSTAEEWIKDGETGALVPPEEPVAVSRRILEALRDDALVDAAAVQNRKVIAERAERGLLKAEAIGIYRTIHEERAPSGASGTRAAGGK